MKKNISCFTVFLLASMVWAEKAVKLPGITNPYTITATKDKLYITEPITVYIYSLTDFSLIKKFGEEGSGEREFTGLITLHTGPGYIFINSKYKISFFSLGGNFIKEQKKPADSLDRMLFYIPIENRFAVGEFRTEHQASFFSRFFAVLLSETGAPTSGFYITISIYDSNLAKVKDIFTYKHPFFAGKYINPVDIRGSLCLAYGDQLFIDNSDGIIDIFDTSGKHLYSVNPAYEKVKITKTQQRRYLKYWMENLAGYYEQYQGRLRFPVYFPPIRNFFVADERIYVLTFKEIEGKSELLILDMKGQLLKKVIVPLARIDSLRPAVINRYTINNHKLYRLVRNNERQYELHITELDQNATYTSAPYNPNKKFLRGDTRKAQSAGRKANNTIGAVRKTPCAMRLAPSPWPPGAEE
jgi:hypothetical protein